MTRCWRGVLPVAAAMSCGTASAQDAPRPYAAVVCTSEANGPWTEKARGTLTRTRSRADLAYRFEGAGQTFDWRFVTSPQGNRLALLVGSKCPQAKPPPRM